MFPLGYSQTSAVVPGTRLPEFLLQRMSRTWPAETENPGGNVGKPVRNRKSRGKSSWKWRMLVVCLALWWPEMAWNGWMDPQGLPQDGTCCKPPQSAIDLSGVWKMCFFLHLDMGINMSFMQNVGWYLISKRIWTMISVFNITIH